MARSIFSHKLAAGAVAALVLGSGGLLTASAATPATATVLTPIVPCRLLDTRTDSSSLGQGATRTQAVTGTNGDCVIPTDAVGVLMNVTIVNPSASSFLTVWPADQAKPTASSLNWVALQSPTPNAVTSALSSTGAISIFNLQGTVDVIVDVNGYYTPAPSGSGAGGTPGPSGPPGATGPQGPAGADGANGSANRITNAQIALLHWYQDPGRAATFPIAPGTGPFGIAFDGSSIWIANSTSNNVSKMNPATGTMTQTALPALSRPFEVAFDGTNIWVSDNGTGRVSKITAATGVKVGDFSTNTVPNAGSGPLGVAFDGTNIWVANSATGTVSRMNPTTGAVIAEIRTSAVLDSGPVGVAFDGTSIWVTNNQVGTVAKINRTDNTITEFPTTNNNQGQPWGVAFDGTSIWIANDVTDNMAKIDPANGSILVESDTLGQVPQEVAFDGSHLWVSNVGSDNVSRIDPASLETVTISTGNNPQGVVFDGSNVWVANNADSTISRLLP